MLDATTNEEQVRAWWKEWPRANIALHVGAMGWMVLDLDPGHDIKELEKNVGPLPKTKLVATTPREGRHLYFALAEGEQVALSSDRLAPHVDVRSFHSYVLLPPSTTKDGAYAWDGAPAGSLPPKDAWPAYRTDEMVRVANTAREKHRDHDTWIIEADLAENVELCIRWLQGRTEPKRKVSIQGQNGDQVAYETAAMCKSYGISEALAFDLMWEHWNPECLPPWREDEVDHFTQKIENGYKYNTSPPGHMTPAYKVAQSQAMFQAVEHDEEDEEWNCEHWRLVSRTGVNSIVPPTWMVEDLFTHGSHAMLYGPTSSYKTFLALDLVLSVAAPSGLAIAPNWNVLTPGRVVFVAGESRGTIRKRVEAWEKIHFGGAMVMDFFLADPVPAVNGNLEPFLALLKAADPKDRGYKLIVLDTVGRSLQGQNENQQEVASKYTALVDEIIQATGATVLGLHHTGHENTARARGSSVFTADADTVLRCEQVSKYLAKLKMDKQKEADEWDRARFLKLQLVHLTPEQNSLVAIKAGKEDLPAQANKSIVLDIIEKAVVLFLSENPTASYSTRELAEAVAADETVDVGSSMLRQFALVELREDNARPVSKMYDRHTKKWRGQWVDNE